jgi:hypothetical protein
MRRPGFGLNCQTARAWRLRRSRLQKLLGACAIRTLKNCLALTPFGQCKTQRCDLAARRARVLVLVCALCKKRARGTPDAWCARGLMRKVKSARVRHHESTGYIRRVADEFTKSAQA